MNRLFQSATLQLTGWYLLVLMIISLLFSSILYTISIDQLRRSLRGPVTGPFAELFDTQAVRVFREQRYREGQASLLTNLGMLNTVALVAGGGASYFLARRTLQPIRQALEAQGRFTSDASHELKTPLTVMQTEIEVGLREENATKALYRGLLESNLDEVNRLRELSDRLLTLSANHELPLKPTMLDDVAIQAVTHIVKPAQLKDITVINEVKPVSVLANADALADAVTILLDNAIKYSPVGTTVSLRSVGRGGKSVSLEVRDQGPGIAAEDLPHIFDRFYRADPSRTRDNVEGHGLGLSIAQRIAQQHHGELTVDSRSRKGATFRIRLMRV
ncbi:MAG TPA: HAMP domain-containing sensor histidine kinase [Candidatus Saccharimonadales bacterium]|jgi:signal transduction histidine kinase